MIKNSLISLVLASAALAGATEYTTVTGSGTGTTDNGGYYGWCSKLTDTFYTTTSEGESATLPDSVSLTSITVNFATSGNSGANSNLKIAIYEYSEDGTVGSFVGLSDNTTGTWTTGGTATLTFTDVTLSSDTQYQFFFVTESATAEALADTSSGSTLLENYQAYSSTLRLAVTQQSSLPSGDGTYTNNSVSGWEGMYIPQVTYATTASVPEPATATLGLLALGALALRRRRA